MAVGYASFFPLLLLHHLLGQVAHKDFAVCSYGIEPLKNLQMIFDKVLGGPGTFFQKVPGGCRAAPCSFIHT
jgi:hypothetical protein